MWHYANHTVVEVEVSNCRLSISCSEKPEAILLIKRNLRKVCALLRFIRPIVEVHLSRLYFAALFYLRPSLIRLQVVAGKSPSPPGPARRH